MKETGKNVAAFVTQCKQMADQLSPGNNFIPSQYDFRIRLAKLIDRNVILQRLYVLLRKV